MREVFGEKVFDVSDVANALGVSEYSIKQLLRNGLLKGRKLANKWIISESNLSEYINGYDKVKKTKKKSLKKKGKNEIKDIYNL